MIGVLYPASRTRSLISGTAAAASLLLTVMRTSSDPAFARSMICRAVAAASAVSVLVIDCTTTALHPPRRTPPTSTLIVFLRLILAIFDTSQRDTESISPLRISLPRWLILLIASRCRGQRPERIFPDPWV